MAMPKHLEAVLTDEIQKCFQITSKDTFYACCNIALHYFQKHPEVKKIRRKNWEALFPEAPITPCSFLNNKNDSQPDYGIYALSREVIGRGNNGKVKFALRLDIPYSKIIAIKIKRPKNLPCLRIVFCF